MTPKISLSISLSLIGLIVLLALIGLRMWRSWDNRETDLAWQSLARLATEPARFDPAMVVGLPEAARRFFLFTIEPGAELRTVSEIRMRGELGLGTKEEPNYGPMQAQQILAPPHGLVWKLRTGRGLLQITGSDGFDGKTSWVRFWLASVVPIVRAGGTEDHARAAFGRVVAEAVFFAPAALLPQAGVEWAAVDSSTARATVTHGRFTQTVDVTVAASGQPVKVVIPRWTDANPDKSYRVQPFGGYLADFRTFDGYVLPTRIEGGNFIGTEDYFPFYKALVEEIRFL